MRIHMRAYRLAVCFAIFALLFVLLPLHKASCQDYFEYKVQINGDGSAVWTITQFSSVNASIESWEGFQQRIFNLVDSAASITHREMTVDENSFQIKTTISSESKITDYSFVWQNFSIIRGSEIILGDFFQVNNFFNQLYGDASLQLSYPSNYSVKSVSPATYNGQDSPYTLRWPRTQDLITGNPSIILTSTFQNENRNSGEWQQYAIIVAVSAVGATLSLVGFYTFKRRKVNSKLTSIVLANTSPIESEEDKVIKILRSSGGNMRQSAITEQCRFSKAKTSQLLAALEKKGTITRYKKGRDKIVNLKRTGKGE
jgi:uncharacterized membrane protein